MTNEPIMDADDHSKRRREEGSGFESGSFPRSPKSFSYWLEIQHELGRDRTIAASAAEQIANGVPLEDIASEPLEALSEWIRAEILDRDARRAPQPDFWKPDEWQE